MKPYIHNPALFHNHFAGQGLPSFKGTRIQRGYGWAGKLKRYAVPILRAGAAAAAPHVSKVVRNITQSAVQRAFPGNPIMQSVASNVTGNLTNRLMGAATGAIKKRKPSKRNRPPAKRRALTLPNIFA